MKMPIPDDWDGVSFCRYAICWPDSPLWKIVLRGLVTEPTRGYFWDERTGSIIGVLAQIRQTMDYNIRLEEVIMACGDQGIKDVATALNKIALVMQQQVIVNAACCSAGGGGSGGTGQTQPPITLVEEGPTTGPPPDGFESWEQFWANKCAVATDIVSTLTADVNRMKTINLIGLTLATLTPILLTVVLTPIPFALS